MPFLTNTELFTMDISFRGMPFCNYTFTGGPDFYTMDITFRGEPFCAGSPPSTGNIKSFCGIQRADLKNLSTTKSLVGIVD